MDPRDDRIARARQAAAERAPEREAEQQRRDSEIDEKLARVDPEGAQRRVSLAARQPSAQFLGPDSTPVEWRAAVDEARRVTIAAARKGTTITYGEIRLAVHLRTGKLVGYSMFGRLVMEMNRKDDGVLLSSIVVTKQSGRPGSGFEPFARSQGFDAPTSTLQRQVFERFRT